ncbi:alpha/beta hydrolase [Sphingomonas bacterium]|uniref:alpha/beta hydrolase n=1 Tax=Sphingomonas bacterium TaxID=1895847 RepID=UPI001575EA85|nr:alpha/beta hydrolase [Sphingomonas bacterium]
MPELAAGIFAERVGEWQVSGRRRSPDRPAAGDVPLIVALHGGSYTSAYFDLPGFSLLDRAATAGIPILALDRPCYGATTPLPPGAETILASAERLDAMIGMLLAQSAEPARPVVLVGHSIGAAITLAIAARQPSWPLAGVAISGMCLASPPEAGAAWAALPATVMIELPPDLKDAVMFGPAHTFGAPMPGLSHAADAPVPRAELLDIVLGWPTIAADILGKVRVPVHYRLAQHDRLWITNEGEVARFAVMLSEAPAVDAGLLRDTGHCTDFHHAGPALQTAQLEFALSCAAPADR